MRLMYSSSFFPVSADDSLPQFVREQVYSIAKNKPDWKILVVAASREGDDNESQLENVREQRFSFWFTKKTQFLTNQGILPAIKSRRWAALQLLPMFISESYSLWQAAKIFRPDYIYSHWFLPQALINHFIARHFQIKHLFTTHSSDVQVCGKVPLVGPYLVRLVLRNVSASTAVSEQTLQTISSYFAKEEWELLRKKYMVLPMGVNLPNHSLEQLRLVNPKKILCMGRLVEKKGFDRLLRAFSILLKENSSLQLTLAGSGPEEDKLKSLAVELGIQSRVRFLGFISGEAKDETIMAHDIFVLPSIVAANGDREGLPVSLLECMSYGRLCIATRESGAEDVLIDCDNGVLCKTSSIQSLVSSITTVTKFSQDEREAMQVKALQTSRNFSWEEITNKMHQHFFNDQL